VHRAVKMESENGMPLWRIGDRTC